jgi:hypothetical protein
MSYEWYFPLGLPNQTFETFLFSRKCTTCPAHRILFDVSFWHLIKIKNAGDPQYPALFCFLQFILLTFKYSSQHSLKQATLPEPAFWNKLQSGKINILLLCQGLDALSYSNPDFSNYESFWDIWQSFLDGGSANRKASTHTQQSKTLAYIHTLSGIQSALRGFKWQNTTQPWSLYKLNWSLAASNTRNFKNQHSFDLWTIVACGR